MANDEITDQPPIPVVHLISGSELLLPQWEGMKCDPETLLSHLKIYRLDSRSETTQILPIKGQ